MEEISWDFGMDMYTLLYLRNQQESTAQHRELCSTLCNNLDGKRINCREKKKKRGYVYMLD